jgi:bifunctional UDP-N-acetylglucosamine pyrophosphorylase / glucosamine-1-phosphate N-acetyltransferase
LNKKINPTEDIHNKRNLLESKAIKLIVDGVLVHDPKRLDIRGELIFGSNVEIDINVIIEGRVVLGDDVIIGANSILKNCQIGNSTIINPFSLIDGAIVGNDSLVGPYARLRPKSVIGDNVQIGNFVEIKNSKIDKFSRINHLSFIGDADLAESVTIGAGTITCNHDGVGFNHTSIEKNAYIGSGCNLVAPLLIKKCATVAAGSTITADVSSNSLAIARSRQKIIRSWQGSKQKNE